VDISAVQRLARAVQRSPRVQDSMVLWGGTLDEAYSRKEYLWPDGSGLQVVMLPESVGTPGGHMVKRAVLLQENASPDGLGVPVDCCYRGTSSVSLRRVLEIIERFHFCLNLRTS